MSNVSFIKSVFDCTNAEILKTADHNKGDQKYGLIIDKQSTLENLKLLIINSDNPYICLNAISIRNLEYAKMLKNNIESKFNNL